MEKRHEEAGAERIVLVEKSDELPNDPDEIMKLWRAMMETPEKVTYTEEKAKAILQRAMAIMANTTDPDEIMKQSEAVTKLWERVWEKKGRR